MFKIRNKDGLYSSGGSNPNFTKNGKTWNTFAHVNAHLLNLWVGAKQNYVGCSLVRFELQEIYTQPLYDQIITVEDAKAAKELRKKNEIAQLILERDMREMNRIKKLYGMT